MRRVGLDLQRRVTDAEARLQALASPVQELVAVVVGRPQDVGRHRRFKLVCLGMNRGPPPSFLFREAESVVSGGGYDNDGDV